MSTRLLRRCSASASFPHAVVLPTPCRPAIRITWRTHTHAPVSMQPRLDLVNGTLAQLRTLTTAGRLSAT